MSENRTALHGEAVVRISSGVRNALLGERTLSEVPDDELRSMSLVLDAYNIDVLRELKKRGSRV